MVGLVAVVRGLRSLSETRGGGRNKIVDGQHEASMKSAMTTL
jgi:hypothetical protein